MILTAGERTDIVQYYTPWFMNRLHEGFVDVRNPFYPKRVNRYRISPEIVEAIVFCSKNYEPILPYLPEIMGQYPIYCFYTITACGRDIEPNVPSVQASVDTFRKLSDIVGKKRTAWRYDPVLIYGPYSAESHLKQFEAMASALSPYTSRCIFSFVYMYGKLKVTFPDLKPVSRKDRLILAEGFGKIAASYGMTISTCGDPDDYTGYGIRRSGCLSTEILSEAEDMPLKQIPCHNARPGTGCRCIDQRAIGAYDTCPNGCRYCYANHSRSTILRNRSMHDPYSSMLIGHLQKDDELVEGKQVSYRKRAYQERLF